MEIFHSLAEEHFENAIGPIAAARGTLGNLTNKVEGWEELTPKTPQG